MDSTLSKFESWSESEIENKLQEVLESIQKVLSNEESDHEIRLYCVQFAATRIIQFVPVYEAEDSLFYPILSGVQEFLDQIFSWALGQEPEERVMLISIAQALIGHTDSLLQYSKKYEGLSPAIIPSIPRLLPKIIHTVFKFCYEELSQTESENGRDALSLLYSSGKSILETLIDLVQSMTIHPYLEDEIDVLVDLLAELARFHEVLHTLDLKACMNVWNFYSKFATDYFDHMKHCLKIEEALITLMKEFVESYEQLHQCFEGNSKLSSKRMNKMIIALAFLMKLTHNLSELYRNSIKSNFSVLIDFLSILYDKESMIPASLDDFMREKLDRELFLVHPPQLFLQYLPDFPEFITYLTSSEINESQSFPLVVMCMQLLEHNSLTNEEKCSVLGLVMDYAWMLEADNCRKNRMDSVEVPGSPVQLVSTYEWLLTRICRFISVVQPEDFSKIEKIFFHHLFFSEELFTLQIVSDVLCFIARYGSASLCYSIIETISKVFLQMEEIFPNRFSIQILIGRLFNFLEGDEKQKWMKEFRPSDTSSLDLWSCVVFNNIDEKENYLNEEGLCNLYSLSLDTDEYLMKLTSLINCHTNLNLIQEETIPSSVTLCLDIWQKLSDYLFAPSQTFGVCQLLNSLCGLSAALAANLPTSELLSMFISQVTVLNSAKGDANEKFITGILMGVLKLVPSFTWVSNIENVDPCLVTQLGTISSLCLRIAVRDPMLKVGGLEYLRNLAEASNNPGLIRKEVDERMIKDNTCPSLLSLLFSEDSNNDSGDNQQDQGLKRTSSPLLASVKTKRSRGELETSSQAPSPVKDNTEPTENKRPELSALREVEFDETKIKSLVESIEKSVGELRDIHENKENGEAFSNETKSLLKSLGEQLIAFY